MHEVSIAEGILSAVESTLVNEPDAKVSSVTVNIGELAKLVIEQVAGEAWCMKCAKNVPLHRHGDPCPQCGGYQLMPVKGHELKVASLELAVDAS